MVLRSLTETSDLYFGESKKGIVEKDWLGKEERGRFRQHGQIRDPLIDNGSSYQLEVGALQVHRYVTSSQDTS